MVKRLGRHVGTFARRRYDHREKPCCRSSRCTITACTQLRVPCATAGYMAAPALFGQLTRCTRHRTLMPSSSERWRATKWISDSAEFA